MREKNITVGSEEWEIHASLVHAHPHFLRWDANEAWDICTAKDIATDTILQDHAHRSVDFSVHRVVITSPVCTPLL